MLINFCHPHLNSSLSCDTVCCDGYEVSNLITEDPCGQKGFLADSFVKPPVTVCIKLTCDIKLSHVVIYPRVGIQKSVGFELYASQGISNRENEQRLISVGFIRNNEDVVIFSRKKNLDHSPTLSNVPFTQHLFYSRNHDFLNSVQTISIKITRTLDSSIPSLKKVEVWGEPGLTCGSACRKEIKNLWTNSISSVVNKKLVDSKHRSEICDIIDIDDDELVIPEEFIDILTFHIMAQPMLLPSGKVVDQLTLEKCAKADAQNGRQPSDPFTGEVFTASRKPVFFSSLKSRIDKFLSANAHHKSICNTSRTSGRKKRTNKGTVSQVVNKVLKINDCGSSPLFQSTSGGVSLYDRNQERTSERINCIPKSLDSHLSGVDSSKSGSPIKKTTQASCNSENDMPSFEVIDVDQDSDEIICLSDDDCSSSPSNSLSLNVHMPLMTESESLDKILKETLAGLPSFAQQTRQNSSKSKECFNCASDLGLYLFPCSHISCRSCFFPNLKDLKVTCQSCTSIFESSKLVRFHQ